MTQESSGGAAVRDLPDYSAAAFCFNASPDRRPCRYGVKNKRRMALMYCPAMTGADTTKD